MRPKIPGFTGSTGAFGGRQAGGTSVNKGGAVSFLVDALKIDDKLGRVVLCEREDFGAKEGHDVIGDDGGGFDLEIRVVDAEVGVEPVDLVGDELAGDEALGGVRRRRGRRDGTDLGSDVGEDLCALFLLALEDGGGVSGHVFDALERGLAARLGGGAGAIGAAVGAGCWLWGHWKWTEGLRQGSIYTGRMYQDPRHPASSVSPERSVRIMCLCWPPLQRWLRSGWRRVCDAVPTARLDARTGQRAHGAVFRADPQVKCPKLGSDLECLPFLPVGYDC